jgi:hypothetical protein
MRARKGCSSTLVEDPFTPAPCVYIPRNERITQSYTRPLVEKVQQPVGTAMRSVKLRWRERI